uniref:Sperm protein n=1 Tax=Littorina obtusata TaxID=31218 RepID=A0A0G3EXS2_LITOB|nr:sperm protein [Littorina obtusata]
MAVLRTSLLTLLVLAVLLVVAFSHHTSKHKGKGKAATTKPKVHKHGPNHKGGKQEKGGKTSTDDDPVFYHKDDDSDKNASRGDILQQGTLEEIRQFYKNATAAPAKVSADRGVAAAERPYGDPGEDLAVAEAEHGGAGADYAVAEAEHGGTGDDHAVAEAEHGGANAEHAVAEAEHGGTGDHMSRHQSLRHSDRTTDYAVAEAEHGGPDAEHAVAEAEHGGPDAEHAVAEAEQGGTGDHMSRHQALHHSPGTTAFSERYRRETGDEMSPAQTHRVHREYNE